MAETRPKKRGRPPGSRVQKPPPPIPDIFIPTAFSRSGRPIKMKELADGSHFGLMSLPVATKEGAISESPSPSPPPAKKRKLGKRGPARQSVVGLETEHSEVNVVPPGVCLEEDGAEMRNSATPEWRDEVETTSQGTILSTEEETENSAGNIYLLRTTAEEGKSSQKKKKTVPRKAVSDGHNSVFIKARTKEGYILEIEIKRNDRKVPSKVIREEATKLKNKIENGEPLPPVVQKYVDEVLQQKLKKIQKERDETFAHKDAIAKELDHVHQMAECDLIIKDALSKAQWDHSKCLGAFRRLWSVPVTRQMLFKFPKAFETARYVYRRLEELEAFMDPDSAPDQEAIFRHHICEAAKKVYEAYRSVFPYAEDRDFWDHFAAELANYQEGATTMSTYDYFSSDRLPCVYGCFNV